MGAARQDAHSRDRAAHGHFAKHNQEVFAGGEGIVEPAFQTPDRPSKLDPYAKQLTAWLTTDQRKSRKERRTAKLMHADLVKLGYEGSYERVAAFVREWKGERQRTHHTTDRGTFVPLVFAPGEAFQFDWSEDWAYVGGERTCRSVPLAVPCSSIF